MMNNLFVDVVCVYNLNKFVVNLGLYLSIAIDFLFLFGNDFKFLDFRTQ